MRKVWRVLMLSLAGTVAASADRGASGHDVYTGLYDQSGQICCRGDPSFGDCEALGEDQVHVNADRSVTMVSRRYGARVRVGAGKVTWLPVRGSDAPAHWCGTPRSRIQAAPVEADNPDPDYWTYCAFVAPGGT